MAAYGIPAVWGQPAPEWLSLQQAALAYGVSVDTLPPYPTRSTPSLTLRPTLHPRPCPRPRQAVPTHPDRQA